MLSRWTVDQLVAMVDGRSLADSGIQSLIPCFREIRFLAQPQADDSFAALNLL